MVTGSGHGVVLSDGFEGAWPQSASSSVDPGAWAMGVDGVAQEIAGQSGLAWRRDVVYLGSQAVAEIDANGVHELHSDHLGSPRLITKGAGTWASSLIGTAEATQAYGPYGELLSQTGSYLPTTGYTGHLQTDASGLIYMRGRYYSPAWHAFVNSDQGADSGQWNQRAYVGGSPFMGTDPSGMQKIAFGSQWYFGGVAYTCANENGCDTDNVLDGWDRGSGTRATVDGSNTPWGQLPSGFAPWLIIDPWATPIAGSGSSGGGGSPQTPKPNPCNKAVSWWPKSVGAQVGGQFDTSKQGGGSAQGAAGVLFTPFSGSTSNLGGAYATGGSWNAYGTASRNNYVNGSYAGAGTALVLSNASVTSQLRGPSTTYTYNAGLGISVGISLSISDSGVWSLSVSVPWLPGAGLGKSETQYTTNTATTPCN